MEHAQHAPDGRDGQEHVPDVGADVDPLLTVRTALDDVDQLSLDERADVFERTHRVVVDELRALELG